MCQICFVIFPIFSSDDVRQYFDVKNRAFLCNFMCDFGCLDAKFVHFACELCTLNLMCEIAHRAALAPSLIFIYFFHPFSVAYGILYLGDI